MMEGRRARTAEAVGSQILERADRDVAFIPRVTGESLHLLTSHFVDVIEEALAVSGVGYGDHPLLRPFVELHSRELTEFVLNGIGLRHQFGIQALERMAGDPAHLLRVDLWDSFNSMIADAERSFLHNPDGLQALLARIRDNKIAKPKAAHREV
jgi:hypothetical protein